MKCRVVFKDLFIDVSIDSQKVCDAKMVSDVELILRTEVIFAHQKVQRPYEKYGFTQL